MTTSKIQTLLQSPTTLVAVSHSGGKDSQAMLIKLLALGIPTSRMLVVHATLGEVEWPGALEHARQQAEAAGVAFVVAQAFDRNGNERTLLGTVEEKAAKKPNTVAWPSKKQRWCTSDLKRGPIDREIRRYAAAHGFTTVVSASGLRAEESTDRAKAPVWQVNERNTNTVWAWFDWLPIHELTTAEVFQTIKDAGQEPHPAYAAGNARLSCMFCIFANRGDLQHAARVNPALAAKYMELEARTGFTMHMSRKPLSELIAA